MPGSITAAKMASDRRSKEARSAVAPKCKYAHSNKQVDKSVVAAILGSVNRREENAAPDSWPHGQSSGESTLRIHLLGGFALYSGDDGALPLPPTRKARSLFAYLVTYCHQPCSREMLAELFWPERPGDRALRSLSTALWQIRRILPSSDYLLTDAQTARFDPASDHWLDVAAFERLASRAGAKSADEPHDLSLDRLASSADPSSDLEALERAAALYEGDFLEGFYDPWCLEVRYRLQGLYSGVLLQLVKAHHESSKPHEALHYAELLLARDPLREDAHRLAVQLHAELGNRAEAIRQARWCCDVLRSELGVEPQTETAELWDALLGPAWRRELAKDAPVRPTPPSRGQVTLTLESPPFVGRETEWGTLLHCWDQARSGGGRLALVSGEAGIGKTRLVEELGRHIRQQGDQVIYGCCYEYERSLPYGLLVDVLRGVLTAAGCPTLEHLPDWQVAELASLAPGLVQSTQSSPVLSLSADQQQVRLFEAVTLLILDLARQGPLLLILEDLHWIDDSALAWLHYLARRLSSVPVLLLATYRPREAGPAHPLHGLALELEQVRESTRIELGRLSRRALARWMAGASRSLVHRVHGQSEGNPFFVLETLRSLFEEEKVRLVDGQWIEDPGLASLPISTSVRQVILQRAERLSPQAREMSSIAAVIGRAFDFDVLERVWNQDEGTTLDTLDELLRYHLVREADMVLGRDYEFEHNLVREVLYQDLHYRRRQRFHRLVAEAMAQSYVDHPDRIGAIAHHYERAKEPEQALAWLIKAGDYARECSRLREALVHYGQAADLLDAKRHDATAARILTGLASAHQGVLGGDEQTWQWLERALAIWESLDNPNGIAEVHYALAYRHADFDRARAQVRRGIEAAEDKAGLETVLARGYGLLARFFEHEGRFIDARTWSERQRDLSERVGDQRGLAHAHHRLGSLLLRVGGPLGKAVAHEREAACLAEDLGWLDFAAGSRNIAGSCLLAMGSTVEAEQSCRTALRLSTELNIPWRQCWAYHLLAEVASLRGEWQEAEHLLNQAEETMVHSSTRFQEIVLLRARGRMAARRGAPEAARPLLEAALEISQGSYPRSIPELELDLIALNLDGEEATAIHSQLEQIQGQVEQSGIEGMLARADRLRGQALALADSLVAADRVFDSSLRRFETLQQAIEAARTRQAWGEALMARDAARARDLLASAASTFAAAEAWPEAEAVRQLLA